METKILLLGATGDLAKLKLFPAFSALGIIPMLYGRKDVDLENYIKGELDEIAEKVSDKGITHVYVSLPPVHYEKVLRQLGMMPSIQRIALEKPFGVSYDNAKALMTLIRELHLEEKIYLVDHYLAKPALIEIAELDNSKRKLEFDPYRINTVWIDAFETNTVEHRGTFYDGVGTIRDFLQNHMLVMISTLLMQGECSGKASECREGVLKKVEFIEGSLVVGQYDGYMDVPGVSADSRTETYAACTFRYDKLFYINVRVGKALARSEVSISIDYKVGHKNSIHVQSSVNPYERILQDFLGNASRFSLSMEESLVCWSITESILATKDYSRINIYPQGTDPDRYQWQ